MKKAKKYDTIWHRTILQHFYMIIAYFFGDEKNIRKTNQKEHTIRKWYFVAKWFSTDLTFENNFISNNNAGPGLVTYEVNGIIFIT